MYPRMEKTRTPAMRQVMVLTMHVMMASLAIYESLENNCPDNCKYYFFDVLQQAAHDHDIKDLIRYLILMPVTKLTQSDKMTMKTPTYL